MNRKSMPAKGAPDDDLSPGQVDPAALNKVNREKVEKQTQAVTREKRQDKPAPPSTP